jgi:formylglycine-generating enzyme required for sulfatase activity
LKVEGAPQPVQARRNAVDGAEMLYIPAGEFVMGDDDQGTNPRHSVQLSGFWMYRNVVTVRQYSAFWKATKRPMAPEDKSSGPGANLTR